VKLAQTIQTVQKFIATTKKVTRRGNQYQTSPVKIVGVLEQGGRRVRESLSFLERGPNRF
jgi:hypothetical protein